MLLDSSGLNKEKKKLKKYKEENDYLDKLLKHIRNCGSFKDLKTNPLSRIYGFEELKHDLSGYFGFRIGKSGTIRLILSVDEDNNIVKIEFISVNHYDDFKRKLKKGV